jgi:hypothetical protein
MHLLNLASNAETMTNLRRSVSLVTDDIVRELHQALVAYRMFLIVYIKVTRHYGDFNERKVSLCNDCFNNATDEGFTW